MKLLTKKILILSILFLSFYLNHAIATTLCGDKTIGRDGEVPINQNQCLTDYGHYFYFNVPYENSDVTITTSGGTYNGVDADLTLYSGDYWDDTQIEQQSITANSNDESLTFVSRSGRRYFYISGDIQQTTLLVSVNGGDIPPPLGDYIVFDTNIIVDIPSPVITAKSQYAAIIPIILKASYNSNYR